MAARAKTVSSDRVLYPRVGFTKSQVGDFYRSIAKFLLPHLRNRPVALKRFPDTVKDESFWEKEAPPFTPDWVRTFPVRKRSGLLEVQYILIHDERTLLWAADLGMVEIHPFLHNVPDLDQPSHLVFDLDHGEGASILDGCDVALLLRDCLAGMGLQSLVKVSGSTGLQVYVPLNTPVTYAVTARFAKVVAEKLARSQPKRIVTKMPKEPARGKVRIDWSPNAESRTMVSVYSLRASSDWPYVSMPLTWREVESAKQRGAGSLQFEPGTALKRLRKLGDLFAPLLTTRQELPGVSGTLAAESAKRPTRKPSERSPATKKTGSG